MLDTIKVVIPLTENQHRQVVAHTQKLDRWQWAQHKPATEEIIAKNYTGAIPHNLGSYNRNLSYSVDPTWRSEGVALMIETSLPKFVYGHNIFLLYDWYSALEELRVKFSKHLGLGSDEYLIAVDEWRVNRLDICYAWRFPNQVMAQSYLDMLKLLTYPRKAPTIYPTSIFFGGKASTYSLKFYLKLPEFKVHDRRALRDSGVALELVDALEALADGVLRVEVTCRSKFLRKHEVVCVKDVKAIKWVFDFDGIDDATEDYYAAALSVATAARLGSDGRGLVRLDGSTPLKSGDVFEVSQEWIYEHTDRCYFGDPFSVSIEQQQKPLELIRMVMDTYLGNGARMRSADKVLTRLMEIYKPTKAMRLASFWLAVQKYGKSKALKTFGSNSFYRAQRELKQAGIGFLSEVRSNVVEINPHFLEDFQMDIPSPYAVNSVDMSAPPREISIREDIA